MIVIFYFEGVYRLGGFYFDKVFSLGKLVRIRDCCLGNYWGDLGIWCVGDKFSLIYVVGNLDSYILSLF